MKIVILCAAILSTQHAFAQQPGDIEDCELPSHTAPSDAALQATTPAPASPAATLAAVDITTTSTESARIVREILTLQGMLEIIKVYNSPSMATACATFDFAGAKVVYFDEEWLTAYSEGDYWTRAGVLTHEIGHHISDHNINSGKNKWQLETEADRFAGLAIRKLGGTLQQALHAVAKSPVDNGDYPGRAWRETSIKQGYESVANLMGTLTSVNAILANLRLTTPVNGGQFDAAFSPIPVALSEPGAKASEFRPLIYALVERSNLDWMRAVDDNRRRSIWNALMAVPIEWWSLPDWEELNFLTRQNIAQFDNYAKFDQVVTSRETTATLTKLKSHLGYSVPPGRIIAASPAAVRLDYCATPTCDVEVILRGYDERANLRYDSSATLKSLKTGDVRQTKLGVDHEMYIEVGQQLVDNRDLYFKLFCRKSGKVVEGDGVTILWSEAHEVSGGYTVWISCGNSEFQASLALGVRPSFDRAKEPPVRPDPGPPTG